MPVYAQINCAEDFDFRNIELISPTSDGFVCSERGLGKVKRSRICTEKAIFDYDSLLTKMINNNRVSIPEYVKQCRRDDPKLTECFISSLEHLKPYLAKGIPEIEEKLCNF
uniref:Uncharacterized protein n=1 Tax=Glossina pallidipes TaxID=7398 RepID=A0A1A9ZUN6_GLOPL